MVFALARAWEISALFRRGSWNWKSNGACGTAIGDNVGAVVAAAGLVAGEDEDREDEAVTGEEHGGLGAACGCRVVSR